MLPAPLVLLWGCAGLTSGNSARTSTPSPQTYGISGTISPTASGAGATVSLSGATSSTTTADNSGAYTFTGLANGSYVVSPSRTGYTFSPATQSIAISGANVTGINFTAIAPGSQTFTISGTISPTAGGAGATVTLGGAAAATTTANSAGGYSFLSLANGSYTITPANLGFSFAPASQNVKVNAANVSGVNFTATPQPTHSVSLTWSASPTTTVTLYNIYRSTLSGNLYAKVGATQAPGLSYTDTLVQNGTTYYYVTTAVDASGSESVYSNQVSAVIP